MRKALVVIAVIVIVAALIVWVASWFRNEDAVVASAARPWPGGTAASDSPMHANDASVKLTTLVNALPKNEVVETYVAREVTRGGLMIGKPPALADVSAIRELLLREPVVWERVKGIGGGNYDTARRTMHMTVARMLIASALTKARANDSSAWEDLHAVWKLARSLDGHPQMMAQTAALSMARMINAVAWKMPLPAPAWFGELQARDNVPALLEAFHHQTMSYAEDGLRLFPTKMLAESVDRDRSIAEELYKETRCDVNPRANETGVDLTFVWRRAFRYRAEREATANALRVREGKSIDSTSRCKDGAWTFDGTTLRFSREIPTAPPGTPMPLVLQVQRAPGD